MPDRRFAVVLAVFAAVLLLAVMVCVSGFISLFADLEVLAETDAGPVLAPLMLALATAAFFLLLVWLGEAAVTSAGRMLATAIIIGIAVYLAYLLTGAILYAAEHGAAVRGVLFALANGVRPYAIAVGISTAGVSLAYLLLLLNRRRGGSSSTPLWPWERDDDERSDDRELRAI